MAAATFLSDKTRLLINHFLACETKAAQPFYSVIVGQHYECWSSQKLNLRMPLNQQARVQNE